MYSYKPKCRVDRVALCSDIAQHFHLWPGNSNQKKRWRPEMSVPVHRIPDMSSRALGRGVRWVPPHPLTRHKGLLNLRGRVKMTLRMQEKWTSTTWFFKISREIYPGIPPRRSCFQCSHPPKQNPAYGPVLHPGWDASTINHAFK